MQLILFLPMLLGCCFISYQDFSQKLIHVGSVLLLAVGVFIFRISEYKIVFQWFLINSFFLIALSICLYLYFRIRRGEKQIVNKYIGLGDVLLFLIFCFAYNLHNYVMFILFSCVLGLLYWIFVSFVSNKKNVKIPLAGIMAFVHLIVAIFCFIMSFDPLTT